MNNEQELNPTKEKIHQIIFEADTPLGKAFDIALLVIIIASVLAVLLESVDSLDQKYHAIFDFFEWGFTIIFTIEYALRIYCVHKPWKYVTSFFGIVDLLAILPSYLSLVITGTESLIVIRALRLLRVFRIFKLAGFVKESAVIIRAMRASRQKIFVFLFFIILLVVILGSMMYLVESQQNSGFDSIPRSIYWAVVTLTTVGYGDISPQTPAGQFLAACVMILGYAVIAVPTGIVTAEFAREVQRESMHTNTQVCRICLEDSHDDDAIFCKKCGNHLHD